MLEISVVHALLFVILAPLFVFVLLYGRRHVLTSPARTLPEVVARLLLCLGCLGTAIDRAIVIYRREHSRLRPEGEADRGRREAAERRAMEALVSKEAEEAKWLPAPSRILSLLAGRRCGGSVGER